jgi:hypothetical protein
VMRLRDLVCELELMLAFGLLLLSVS